jgi:molybdopterin-containing oxidoreductase family iron-sulfur binding subunit
MSKEIIKLQDVRARLAGDRGKRQWRSIEELAETAEFDELVRREFPSQAGELRDPVTRRSFLKMMGASLALAGLTGCEYNVAQPQEKIVPYVRLPEGLIPGKPLFFATAMPFQGYGLGLVVEQHEGRPTKIEGNPDHPATMGASNVWMQASILTMYDPDRSKSISYNKQESTWENFTGALTQSLNQLRGNGGAGMRLLTETITSPTLIAQIQQLQQAFPQMQWVQYDPISRDNVRAGAQLAFGNIVNTIYDFSQARTIVSLDSDFMVTEPGHLRYARQFAQTRLVRKSNPAMSRFYVAESTPTITSTQADHRLPVSSSRIDALARAIAAQVGVGGVTAGEGLSDAENRWVTAVVQDLKASGGASIVITGEQQPPVVHALVHAINQQLGNVGKTVQYTNPIEANPGIQFDGLRQLVTDMNSGAVQLLLMLEGNPVYNAPADLNFTAALKKVPLSIHYGLFNDETSANSTWHVNASHYLEMWSDVRAFDGTASVIQPLIAPLYGSRSPHELLDALLGQPPRSGYDVVRGYWQGQLGTTFEQAWESALRNGVLPNTAQQPQQVSLQGNFAAQQAAAPAANDALEIAFRPDPSVWDGSYANNGWMQELPNPFTKLTWDNAAYVSPKRAQDLSLQEGDVVTLNYKGQSIEAPVIPLPGQADNTVTVHLGYGRQNIGVISAPDGVQIGFNAYQFRTSDAPWFNTGLQVQKTGRRHDLVTTRNNYVIDQQVYSAAERREIVRVATLDEYQKNPTFAQPEPHRLTEEQVESTEHNTNMVDPVPQGGKESPYVSLLPNYPYPGYAWGMTIDLNTCIGCNACVTACQAENNIPVVGKQQVALGREMFWIRIDQYYHGDLENPRVYNQPMLCQHCEHAPCELVCPVAATVHDAEGLNAMVYNRCVGTKYCSNNCPYKVRRFNFLQYQDEATQSLKLQRNPNVTVRSRGVMEKCTYCVQRIAAARQDAERLGQEIQDGGIITACQQACPTNAIVFGNINDKGSQVAQLKAEPTNYGVLTELNTQPRTTYLARVWNPNPAVGETE